MALHSTKGGHPCGLCVDPRREEIELSLLQGLAAPALATRYGFSVYTIRNHRDKHMLPELAQMEDAAEKVRAGRILLELSEHLSRVKMLSDAYHEWLLDPSSDGEAYDIGPRAEEITVIYRETVDGKPIRRKALLSDLIEKAGVDAVRVEFKHEDPRRGLLSAYDRAQSQLELVAKITGHLKTQTTHVHGDLIMTAEFVKLQQTLNVALMPYPEAKAAAAKAFAQLGDGS